MKAILIDSVTKTISEVEYTDVAGLHALVDEFLEIAYMWPNGDTLFVDEEGLLKNPQNWFSISVRPDQPLAGNGVLVGIEIPVWGEAGTEPPTMTVEQLRKIVVFHGEVEC